MKTGLTWKTHLARAKAKGYFSQLADTRAGMWQTCAVGERLAHLRIDVLEIQSNYKLRKLGYDFNNAVRANKIDKASRLYTSINKCNI